MMEVTSIKTTYQIKNKIEETVSRPLDPADIALVEVLRIFAARGRMLREEQATEAKAQMSTVSVPNALNIAQHGPVNQGLDNKAGAIKES